MSEMVCIACGSKVHRQYVPAWDDTVYICEDTKYFQGFRAAIIARTEVRFFK